jgi:uroporphyrinogen III methyltransferase/synthase
VKFFFDRLAGKGKDTRALAGRMIAAVGDTTAAELRAHGVAPDLIPDKFQSIALLPFFEGDRHGVRFAIVRAAEGKDDLIDALRQRGAEVDLAVAYETRAADFDLAELREWIANDAIDVVTFTSASTVDHFFAKLTAEERAKVNARAILASIGPVTSEAIRRYGKAPDVESVNASVQALHDAIVERVASATFDTLAPQ